MAVKLLTGADLNAQRATNAADPSSATDLATKQYVDNLVNGLSWKGAVRAATTANGALATAYANGQVIDGVTLATGNRILIKNQTTQSENGIYVVAASGAPTRALDADSGAELVNATVYVSEGTTQADTAWTQTANATITVGTTALTWVQQGTGGTTYTGGNGISVVGTVISAVANTGVTVTGSGIGADFSIVGRKFTQLIGDGTSTSIAVTHSLGNQYPLVQVYDVASGALQYADYTATSTTVTTFAFAVAPATNAIRVVIIG